MRDRINALRNANVYESQRYRHVVGAPLVDRASDGAVEARTNFVVARIMHTGETMLFATGRYVDRIIAGPDGAMLYADKIVVLDSRQIDTLLAIPL